jgi:phi13 family phage major tail protein
VNKPLDFDLQRFANKVTFGLEKVHVAFKGVAQMESIAVTAGCGTDGEITVTITGAALGAASPLAVKVALAAESHAAAAQVASVVVNTLNNDEDFAAAYVARRSGATIYVVARVVAANDATLDIAFTPGDTGVTVGSSTAVTAGTTGWGVPTAIPGAVRWTPTAQGQETTFRADNGPYFVVTSNNGYTGELEMALVPDAIQAEMLGWEIDDNGALIEIANATPKPFALMGQVEGDERNRRFVYYDSYASRPAKEQRTKGETIEPNTDVLNLTVLPIEIDGRTCVKGDLELSASNAAAYNAFFDAVYTPVFS